MVVESLGPAERGGETPPHSRQDARALRFAAQVEEFRVLLAMVDERPLFGVMIVVDQGEDHFLHVCGIGGCEIGRVHVGEGNDSTVGRETGLHAWLVARGAVVREKKATWPVKVEHGHHVLFAEDLAHDGGASCGDLEGDLNWPHVGVPFPCSGECLDGGEGLLRSGLGQG